MPDAKILQGWKEIETFARESRMTLLKKQYPIHKDAGGSVWADPVAIEGHRLLISAKMCENVLNTANDLPTPLN